MSHDRAQSLVRCRTDERETMGLLSGRSQYGTRKSRPSSAISSRTSRRKKDEDREDVVEEVPKPDIDELRRQRTAYYSLSDRERRQISSQRQASTSKSKSKPSLLPSSRSASAKDGSHRRRKHRSSSSREKDKAEDSMDSTRRRTQEYVYAGRRPPNLEAILEESQAGQPRPDRRHSKHSSSSRRHSTPTAVDAEVTPDDSISQIGEKPALRTGRFDAYVRPSLKRSSTTSAKLHSIPEASKHARSSNPQKRSSRPPPSISGTLPTRRHSTTSIPEPPKLVDCLTCGADDIPITKSAKLSCTHRMCQDCLKRVFEMSVKDPAHMPPKCCGDEHIPLKHVDKLFDLKFKKLWNTKYQEFNTKNRIYCPNLKCGEWIKPGGNMHTVQGRKYLLCPRCKTRVCPSCNNKMHRSTDCPKDPEIAKLVEQAKEKGWQRCYSCSAFVERKEGCNHMTCRCMAEFCILCGSKWKTCDCPWFNYQNLPNPDRLNDMRIPEPVQNVFRHVFREAMNPGPPRAAAEGAVPGEFPAATPRAGPLPEVTYQQELDARRRQERLDEDLARRLQLQTLLEPDDIWGPLPRRRGNRNANVIGNRDEFDLVGIGNAARNFMNDDFVQNAANIVMSAVGDGALGRRSERPAGRRRRRDVGRGNDDPALLAENPWDGPWNAGLGRR